MLKKFKKHMYTPSEKISCLTLQYMRPDRTSGLLYVSLPQYFLYITANKKSECKVKTLCQHTNMHQKWAVKFISYILQMLCYALLCSHSNPQCLKF
jgi:hypothetical protein